MHWDKFDLNLFWQTQIQSAGAIFVSELIKTSSLCRRPLFFYVNALERVWGSLKMKIPHLQYDAEIRKLFLHLFDHIGNSTETLYSLLTLTNGQIIKISLTTLSFDFLKTILRWARDHSSNPFPHPLEECMSSAQLFLTWTEIQDQQVALAVFEFCQKHDKLQFKRLFPSEQMFLNWLVRVCLKCYPPQVDLVTKILISFQYEIPKSYASRVARHNQLSQYEWLIKNPALDAHLRTSLSNFSSPKYARKPVDSVQIRVQKVRKLKDDSVSSSS